MPLKQDNAESVTTKRTARPKRSKKTEARTHELESKLLSARSPTVTSSIVLLSTLITSREFSRIQMPTRMHQQDPLWMAAEAGDAPTVSALLKAGSWANVRGGPNNCSALHVAVANGHKEVMHLLLGRMANPHIADDVRSLWWLPLENVLMSWRRVGQLQDFFFLLRASADRVLPCAAPRAPFLQHGETPLMAAALFGETACAQLMLHRSPSTANDLDNAGRRAVDYLDYLESGRHRPGDEPGRHRRGQAAAQYIRQLLAPPRHKQMLGRPGVLVGKHLARSRAEELGRGVVLLLRRILRPPHGASRDAPPHLGDATFVFIYPPCFGMVPPPAELSDWSSAHHALC